MCMGKKAKAPKPIAPPPPPPPPKQQETVQQAVEVAGTDKRRNARRGMGSTAAVTESMLTGNAGADPEQLKKRLGGANLLGGS